MDIFGWLSWFISLHLPMPFLGLNDFQSTACLVLGSLGIFFGFIFTGALVNASLDEIAGCFGASIGALIVGEIANVLGLWLIPLGLAIWLGYPFVNKWYHRKWTPYND